MFAMANLRIYTLFLLMERRNSLICYPSQLGTGTDPSVTTYPNPIRDHESPTDLVHHGSTIETVDVQIYVCAENNSFNLSNLIIIDTNNITSIMYLIYLMAS